MHWFWRVAIGLRTWLLTMLVLDAILFVAGVIYFISHLPQVSSQSVLLAWVPLGALALVCLYMIVVCRRYSVRAVAGLAIVLLCSAVFLMMKLSGRTSQQYPFYGFCGSLLAAWGFAFIAAGLDQYFDQYAEIERRRGLCTQCGYNLTGNTSGACPECGAAVPGREAAKGGQGVQ